MPRDPNARVQIILMMVIFGGLGIGLLLTGFLRVRHFLAVRRRRRAMLVYADGLSQPSSGNVTQPFAQVRTTTSHIDPYVVAQEALNLVSTVRADNERLVRRLERFETKNPHGGVMPAAQWLGIVNDDPNLVPHVGIEGASRTGKTTLAEGILQARTGNMLIITAKTGDAWGGLPYVTVDDDGSFTTAAATFRALRREVLRRLVATKHHHDPGPWLTVVLDDYPALRDACPEANEPFLLIARIGASLRVRLMLLTYSQSVKELGLDGKGDARHHFAWIKRTRHGAQRTASMEWEGLPYDLDVDPVIQSARQPLAAGRAWQYALVPEDFVEPERSKKRVVRDVSSISERNVPSATPDADALLARFLVEPAQAQTPTVVSRVPVLTEQTPEHDAHYAFPDLAPASDTAGTWLSDADTGENTSDTASTSNTGAHTGHPPRDLPDEVIRALLAGEKWSGNKVARFLHGSKPKRLQRIDQAVQTSVTPDGENASAERQETPTTIAA